MEKDDVTTLQQKKKRKKWRPKGDYVICMEDDGTLYSTDSYFWYKFFGGKDK